MKADRTIRLLKTVPAVQIKFQEAAPPAIEQITGSFHDKHSWTVDGTPTAAGESQGIQLVYDDSIDIAGLSKAELSLINQGGAIATCRPPIVTFPEIAAMRVTTYVSVNPIRGTFDERTLFGNSLAAPSESQDWFMASSQTYSRDSTAPGYMQKISEDNWGTGGIASTSRLFVRVYIRMDRTGIYVPSVQPGQGGFAPFVNAAGVIVTSPMTIGIMAVTAEMDAVQTAAAIYRGNDLQQSYDES